MLLICTRPVAAFAPQAFFMCTIFSLITLTKPHFAAKCGFSTFILQIKPYE